MFATIGLDPRNSQTKIQTHVQAQMQLSQFDCSLCIAHTRIFTLEHLKVLFMLEFSDIINKTWIQIYIQNPRASTYLPQYTCGS